MSTETSSTKPAIGAASPSSEMKSVTPTACATNHGNKSHEAKNTPVLAAQSKAECCKSHLADLASPDSAKRAAAATALGHANDVTAVPALITALRDSDADVAREAAASLGLLGNAAAVEPLIAVLDNRDGYFHSVVRTAATHSLSQLRDLRAVPPLLIAIRDPIAEASAEAIRALASLPDPRGLPALLEVVRNEHAFFLSTTRLAAIRGLAHIGGEQAVCELRFVAGNKWEDAVIRAAAIEAIGSGATSPAPQHPAETHGN
jgi:HEAT repeat protein